MLQWRKIYCLERINIYMFNKKNQYDWRVWISALLYQHHIFSSVHLWQIALFRFVACSRHIRYTNQTLVCITEFELIMKCQSILKTKTNYDEGKICVKLDTMNWILITMIVLPITSEFFYSMKEGNWSLVASSRAHRHLPFEVLYNMLR